MPKQQFDNTNRGVLFKNDDKQSDNHPDYRGKIDVGGDEYRLSAWIKTAKDGSRYMSLSVTPMDTRQAPRPQKQEVDDDLPF